MRLAQRREQIEHGRLHRHVEAGGRLVQDDQARAQHQDAREADAALLAAADLVRIEIEMGSRQADRLERLVHPALALGARQLGVHHQRLLQRAPDLPARIERGARVLVAILQAGCAAPRRRAASGRRSRCPRSGCCRRSARECPRWSCRAWTCRSRIRRRRRGSRRARSAATRRRARAASRSARPRRCGSGSAARARPVRAAARSSGRPPDADDGSAPDGPPRARRRADGSPGSPPRRAGSADGSGSRSAARTDWGRRRECRAAPSAASAGSRAACACRDAPARSKKAPTAAVSTSWPAYITVTRSQISQAAPRSCVVNSTEVPRSAIRLRSSLRICAWIVTSSAVVGSSAITSFGSGSSAIAIIRRWRCPPESSCGYLAMMRSGSGSCTARSMASVRSRSRRRRARG